MEKVISYRNEEDNCPQKDLFEGGEALADKELVANYLGRTMKRHLSSLLYISFTMLLAGTLSDLALAQLDTFEAGEPEEEILETPERKVKKVKKAKKKITFDAKSSIVSCEISVLRHMK